MISQEVIKNLANRGQTTEQNIRREYVQHLFLAYFYQQPAASSIYFKGGTALRLIYRSPRFSEDLDFSASTQNVSSIEEAVVETLREIEREGIETDIVESKKTTGGYLAILHFTLNDQKVSMQIEVSFRQKGKKGEVTTIVGDFIPPYTVTVLLKEQITAEKIQALLTRQKPRDFYDLYFIFRAHMLSPKDKDIIPDILKLIRSKNIQYERELKIFLPKNQWPVLKNFKKVLEKELLS